MDARDHAAIVKWLAPDVVLRSPVSATPFVGREAVSELLRLLIEEYEEWECTGELSGGDTHIMLIRGRIGGREVQLVDVMWHDEEGLVREMRLHGRPMSGVAAFASVVGPRLARRRGRVAAVLVRFLAGPLPRILAVGDRAVSRFALARRAPD